MILFEWKAFLTRSRKTLDFSIFVCLFCLTLTLHVQTDQFSLEIPEEQFISFCVVCLTGDVSNSEKKVTFVEETTKNACANAIRRSTRLFLMESSHLIEHRMICSIRTMSKTKEIDQKNWWCRENSRCSLERRNLRINRLFIEINDLLHLETTGYIRADWWINESLIMLMLCLYDKAHARTLVLRTLIKFISMMSLKKKCLGNFSFDREWLRSIIDKFSFVLNLSKYSERSVLVHRLL